MAKIKPCYQLGKTLYLNRGDYKETLWKEHWRQQLKDSKIVETQQKLITEINQREQ